MFPASTKKKRKMTLVLKEKPKLYKKYDPNKKQTKCGMILNNQFKKKASIFLMPGNFSLSYLGILTLDLQRRIHVLLYNDKNTINSFLMYINWRQNIDFNIVVEQHVNVINTEGGRYKRCRENGRILKNIFSDGT